MILIQPLTLITCGMYGTVPNGQKEQENDLSGMLKRCWLVDFVNWILNKWSNICITGWRLIKIILLLHRWFFSQRIGTLKKKKFTVLLINCYIVLVQNFKSIQLKTISTRFSRKLPVQKALLAVTIHQSKNVCLKFWTDRQHLSPIANQLELRAREY